MSQPPAPNGPAPAPAIRAALQVQIQANGQAICACTPGIDQQTAAALLWVVSQTLAQAVADRRIVTPAGGPLPPAPGGLVS